MESAEPIDHTHVIAGAWSVAYNLLGKIQSLSVVLCGAIAGGFASIGLALAGVGAALLASAAADFGFSTEAGRLCARNRSRRFVSYVGRVSCVRGLLAVAIGPLVLWITAGSTFSINLGQYLAVGVYSSTFLLTSTALPLMYAFGHFKQATITIGGLRLVASLGALTISAALGTNQLLLPLFACFELIASVVCWMYLLRASAINDDTVPSSRADRQYAWLGVAAITNVLTNQSDVLLISAVLSPTAVGIFGLASQLQNAVATLAASAATPLQTFVARESRPSRRIWRLKAEYRRRVFALVFVGLSLLTVVLLIVTWLDLPLSAVHAQGVIPAVVLCVLSAIPSTAAFVDIAVCTGLGRLREIGLARSLSGAIAVLLIFIPAAEFGLYGACVGTILRDSLLFIVCTVLIGRIRKSSVVKEP